MIVDRPPLIVAMAESVCGLERIAEMLDSDYMGLAGEEGDRRRAETNKMVVASARLLIAQLETVIGYYGE